MWPLARVGRDLFLVKKLIDSVNFSKEISRVRVTPMSFMHCKLGGRPECGVYHID